MNANSTVPVVVQPDMGDDLVAAAYVAVALRRWMARRARAREAVEAERHGRPAWDGDDMEEADHPALV